MKDLTEGFKKDRAAWLGNLVKVKGSVTSYTNNKFKLDAKGIHGPEDTGTWFGVHVSDPGAAKDAVGTTCWIEEGKPLADVRKAFDKMNFLEEEVLVEVSGPIEGTFGDVAPCKISKVSVAKRKK